MKLLVDIGNTRIKSAMVFNGNWTNATSQSHRDRSDSVFDQMWRGVSPPGKIVVSNVAGAEFAGSLQRWCEQNWSITPHFIHSEEVGCGVINGYLDANQLGSDRWAALIAARNLCTDPVAIVDCGTAVTVDALDAEGCFRGGVIFAGLALSRNTLLAQASGIDAARSGATRSGVTRSNSESVLCRSTEDAVASGTFYGVVGAIDRILDEFEQQLGQEMKLYLSGGDALSVKSNLRHSSQHDPELVLKGLDLIAEALT